jgi:hypothetical protein
VKKKVFTILLLALFAGLLSQSAFADTRKIVPRATSEGMLGKVSLRWQAVWADSLNGIFVDEYALKEDTIYIYQQIERLDTRVDSVIAEVEALNGRADSLITAINSVNGRADSLITAVETVNTRADSLITAIGTVNGRVDSVITAIESVNTRADSLITGLNNLNTRADSLITGLNSLNTRADSIITGLGNLNTRVDSIIINVIPRLDTRIDSVIANVTGGFDSTFVYQEIEKLNDRADSLITGVNAKLGIADSGSTAGVAGKYWTPTMEANAIRHLRVTIIDPNAAYGKDSCICIWNKTNVAIVITNLEVSCGADPTTEPTGDIKYADAFIGRANPIVINDFDTTNGVRSDSSITAGDVPSGKCVFIRFDAEPEAAMTQITFDISYHL